MHIKKALVAFNGQKCNAKRRGIDFNLTFKQWCDFLGEDIDRRGNGRDQLQMQRPMDKGAYEVGNIKKGFPRENSKTYSLVVRDRNTKEAAERLNSALNAAMFEDSKPEYDELHDKDGIPFLGINSSYAKRYYSVG